MLFTQSLKKSYQFRHVYKKGRSMGNKHMVMTVAANKQNLNLLGISVSKKVGKSVMRNRLTRLIKENYRLLEHRIKPGLNIAISARPAIAGADFYQVGESLRHLIKLHGLFTDAGS